MGIPLGVRSRTATRVGGGFRAYGGMERDPVLVFNPVNHPDRKVRQVGFELSDPYVEQCWSAVVGPSSTLLLRRLPELWRQEVPAEIPASDLSRSLGLGAGTGPNSRLGATMDRLVRFGLMRESAEPGGVDVFLEVAPLRPRQLDRVPEWTRATHERLLSAHLERFDGVTPQPTDLDQFRSRANNPTPSPAPAREALGL